jgi:superoxide dismutase
MQDALTDAGMSVFGSGRAWLYVGKGGALNITTIAILVLHVCTANLRV